jgi:hypothetical protein
MQLTQLTIHLLNNKLKELQNSYFIKLFYELLFLRVNTCINVHCICYQHFYLYYLKSVCISDCKGL